MEIDQAHAFVTNLAEIRRRARQHIQKGHQRGDGALALPNAQDCSATIDGDAMDRDSIVRLLNDALATELVCVRRYEEHYSSASADASAATVAGLLQHAQEEQAHADQLAHRITELGGTPNFNPEGLIERSRSEFLDGESVADMLAEDLIAERIAIDSYREIIQYLGAQDLKTRDLLQSILAAEEAQAEGLRSLRDDVLRAERGSPVAASRPAAVSAAGLAPALCNGGAHCAVGVQRDRA